MKTKLQSLGFTSGHLQILTVAVLVLGGLIFVKSDLNIRTLFAQADSEKPKLTYEQAKAEVIAKNGSPNSADITNANALDQAQLALVDPGNIDGQVLGEAIGIGAIPDADQLQIPEISSQVSIKTASQDDATSRAQYQTATQTIENDADIVTLLSDLNSSDQATLSHAAKGWGWVIDTLENTPVPSSLAEFHKSKIIYYSILMNIGKVYAGEKPESDLQMLTKAMLSYSQKVETLRATINESYKLSL